jgi:hypothetical protein
LFWTDYNGGRRIGLTTRGKLRMVKKCIWKDAKISFFLDQVPHSHLVISLFYVAKRETYAKWDSF